MYGQRYYHRHKLPSFRDRYILQLLENLGPFFSNSDLLNTGSHSNLPLRRLFTTCRLLPVGLRGCAVLNVESPEISFASYDKPIKRKQGELNLYNFEVSELHYFYML